MHKNLHVDCSQLPELFIRLLSDEEVIEYMSSHLHNDVVWCRGMGGNYRLDFYRNISGADWSIVYDRYNLSATLDKLI